MRYSIEKEKYVKSLAEEGKSADYISAITGIPLKVIWNWVPDLRPHDDIIKWSVKQRFRFTIPEWEAKISAAMSGLIRPDVTEDEWEDLNKVLYNTLMEEAVFVFKNVLEQTPDFSVVCKLSEENFLKYLKDFWDYDTSEYVKSKNLKKSYVTINRNSIHYWSILKHKSVKDISKGDIQAMFDKLSAKELSISRINAIMKTGLIPLRFAYKNGQTLNKAYEFFLPKVVNQTHNYELSDRIKVFNSKWEDTESFVANLIGSECQMQLQEVRALRLCDIKDGYIIAKNIYNSELKPNPKDRAIKVHSLVLETILKYVAASPYKDLRTTDYVFYSSDRTKPARAKKWTLELNKVCNQVGITEKVNFAML